MWIPGRHGDLLFPCAVSPGIPVSHMSQIAGVSTSCLFLLVWLQLSVLFFHILQSPSLKPYEVHNEDEREVNPPPAFAANIWRRARLYVCCLRIKKVLCTQIAMCLHMHFYSLLYPGLNTNRNRKEKRVFLCHISWSPNWLLSTHSIIISHADHYLSSFSLPSCAATSANCIAAHLQSSASFSYCVCLNQCLFWHQWCLLCCVLLWGFDVALPATWNSTCACGSSQNRAKCELTSNGCYSYFLTLAVLASGLIKLMNIVSV